MRLFLLLSLLAGCADNPCAGVEGTCIALTVVGARSIDTLEIRVGDGTMVQGPKSATPSGLPFTAALQLTELFGALTVEVNGTLGGALVAVGRDMVTVAKNEHTALTIALGEPVQPGDDLSTPLCCGHVAPKYLSLTTALTSAICGELYDVNDAKRRDLECGRLFFGAGTATVSRAAFAENIQAVASVSGCDIPSGQVTLGKTLAGELGTNGDRRCTAAGCMFGPPMITENPDVQDVRWCMVQTLAADLSGSANCQTGAMSLSLHLKTDLYAPDSLTQACPLCQSGTCNGGERQGMPCTPVGVAGTSYDCPPTAAKINATNPLMTFALSTAGVDHTAMTSGGLGRVFCGYCRDSDGTLAFQDPPISCLRYGATVESCVQPNEACTQRNPGAFGPNNGDVKRFALRGQPATAGALAGGAAPLGLAGSACYAPGSNLTINNVLDLPGPAALNLTVSAELHDTVPQ